MKYRFGVEFEFEGSKEEALDLLDQIIHRGMRAFGHNSGTLPLSIEALRARSVDLDKPVEEQE